MSDRTASLTRTTRETDIRLSLDLDGSGKTEIQTGVGFFDHMLTLFGRHSLFDLTVTAKGDLEVDAHHTVEDVGLLLGEALRTALGDKTGIVRYGHAVVPMDEARVSATLDLSGRPHLVYGLEIAQEKVGDFDTCLGQEFFQALANSAAMNLHIVGQAGGNPHHLLEAAFKATGRALRRACECDPRESGVPSSKGSL